MSFTMRLPRFITLLPLLLATAACTFHEPLQPGVDASAGDAGADHSGAGGVSGSGGKHGGAGGVISTGGSRGNGGALGTGGRTGGGGTGGARGDAGTPVDRPADTEMCGPVCAIFCPHGNVLDDRGCPTCTCKPPPSCPPVRCAEPCKHGYKTDGNGCQTCACNPPPGCMPVTCKIACPNGFETGPDGCEICKCKPPAACVAADCGPAPGAPNIMCSDGSVGGPVCERTSEGRCAWIFRQCPDPTPSVCAGAITAVVCALDPRCRWLEPGCTEPKLAAAGCYARADIDCMATGCPAGKSCQMRVINPCTLGVVGPIPGICSACGETIAVCL